MSSIEQGRQPHSLYDTLFTGFAGLAAVRGTIHHGPLDPEQEPGLDGTLTPDGEQATGFNYTVSEEQLPESLRIRGIDGVAIGSYTRAVMGREVWDARTWVYVHEQPGLIRSVTLYKDIAGEIEADFSLDADTPTIPAKQ